MIENHQIAYRNVASKLYNFLPEEIGLAFQHFDELLSTNGFHVTDTLFFSILSDPTAEVMTAEIFRPIEEDAFLIATEEEVNFRSYFLLNKMVMTRVKENFNELSQVKYWELIDYVQKQGLQQSSPVFVEFKRSHAGETYVEMSVGAK